MNTDPIADLLTRIRNAQTRGRQTVVVPYSKIKAQICDILKASKMINESKELSNSKFKELELSLNNEKLKLTLTRVSRPGQRIYLKAQEIKHIKSGLGIGIISTSKGLMTTQEARKQGLGGELICEVY